MTSEAHNKSSGRVGLSPQQQLGVAAGGCGKQHAGVAVNSVGDGTVSFKSERRSIRRSLSQPHLLWLSSAGGGVQQLWSDMLVGASLSRDRMIVHPPPGIMEIGRTLDKPLLLDARA